MRRLWLAVAFVVCATFCMASNARAQAVVLSDQDCALFDGNGAIVPIPGGGHFVITPSKNGNHEVTCSGIVAPASGGGTVHYDFKSTGLQCNAASCATDKWHEVVTPNGKATITCHCGP
jgi:hypothetical protein